MRAMKIGWVAAGALAFATTLGTGVSAAAGAEAETPTFAEHVAPIRLSGGSGTSGG